MYNNNINYFHYRGQNQAIQTPAIINIIIEITINIIIKVESKY